MKKPSASSPDDEVKAFQQQQSAEQDGFTAEFWCFLTENKKWWLTPILIALLLMGFLILLAGSGAAPFIYTLF